MEGKGYNQRQTHIYPRPKDRKETIHIQNDSASIGIGRNTIGNPNNNNNNKEIQMRKINEIILHCTATKEGKEFHASDVDRWHKAKGWKMIGYHYFIALDGTIEKGRPVEMVGAHTVGHNANSIGIVYCGGLDSDGKPKDTRTPEQKESMYLLVYQLLNIYGLSIKDVTAHYMWANKACPCFKIEDFRKEYEDFFDVYELGKEKIELFQEL